MKRINVFGSAILLLFTFELFTLGLGNAISVSWNGTAWAALESKNGSHLMVVTPDRHISTVPLRVNGTPCGLAWNGSEWLVETFVPDSVVVQTLNGSVLFRIHSYGCRNFAYLDGTYYVPISESAMMGDCSLLLVSPNGSIEKTIPCGSIDGAGIKGVEGRLYFINCTGIYVYSNGAFKRVLQLDNCAKDFDILNDKILLCSNGLIEHSKNGAQKILSTCDAISCNGRECLVMANETLYIYNSDLKTFETKNSTNSPKGTLRKVLPPTMLIVLLTVLLLWKRGHS